MRTATGITEKLVVLGPITVNIGLSSSPSPYTFSADGTSILILYFFC